MSQWGQPGFQYHMQTGFPGAQPQQQFQPGQQLNPTAQFQQHASGFGAQSGAPGLGAGFSGLAPQPTGFPGARLQGLQQPQQTGFPGVPGVGAGLLQAQPTGFLGAQSSFQHRAPPPPVPPLPASYQQSAPPPPPPVPQHQSSFLNANQNRLGGPSASSFGGPGLVTQPTGVGLLSQPTGFGGRAAPLVPHVTGFVDPRLQMMSSSFMPANVSAPYTSGGAPQLAPLPQQQLGGLSLQQSFQQHNQAHGRGTTPKIPWALSKGEKKQYDQIFRAWDAQGTGFINGQTALEVFGQSGLERNDLARIWTLADADNRGKLNLAEFHVAMGLIYRRLNGNDIPDELPAELVPPSSRDLDTSVNFLKDILKNDTRARSPSGLDTPVSRLKERSFKSSSSFTQQGGRQDATVYKHEDVEPPGGFYQPRNRHVDRSTIRSRADDASPATSDLSSIKRQLLNTQKMLDDSLANERSSDALDREMEDLRYRITRLQEDLEYVSKGPRSIAKDEERRRLERELVRLMHEEVPELEKKVEEREGKREREKREWARDRDRRNERFGRFGEDSGGRYSSASRYQEEEERPYSRNASRYDRDGRDQDRDRSYNEDRDRIRDDRDRGVSTPTRIPPSPPPPPTNTSNQPAPPPSAPARSPAPAMKNMTTEERQAYIRSEAQRRLEARKQALGVVAPSSAPATSPTLDTTIEDRLAQEKKEAEEKARDAERQAKDREKQRKEKLDAEKALTTGKTPSPTPTTTAPLPVPASAPVPTPTVKTALPLPKPRAPAPPPPRKGATLRTPAARVPVPRAPPERTPAISPAPAPVAAPPAPVELEDDPEDAALRIRKEALRKRREDREALLRKLEQEEEEARTAEAAYQERRNQFLATKSTPAVPTISTISTPPAPPSPPASAPPAPPPVLEEPIEEAAPPPPAPPPPPPPPPASAPVADKSSTNPFSRLMKEGGGSAPVTTPAATANGSSNPFFRAQTAPPAAPPPSKSPGIPPPVKTTYHTAPKDSDDDWDDVMEKEADDSSDEELGTRDTRMGLAQQLFGNLLPSRPQSAGPGPSSGSPVSPAAPAPPPPPPSAPPALVAPSAPIAAPASTGDRGALLSAIQVGARLRKAVTNDRSGAATSGRVVGEAAPPSHINAVARPLSPPTGPAPPSFTASPSAEPAAPPMGQSVSAGHEKRESVDWYNALAADANKREVHRLPVTEEEGEEEQDNASVLPSIQVSEHAPDNGSELMADVDLSIEIRVRSLYAYPRQRDEDLEFDTNTIIVAHPSKSGSDWWYGTTVKDGKVGFFPQTYVQKVEQVQATALYTYESTNADELSINEGDTVIIVDQSETDWWKAERDGLVFVVPAAYLEAIEDTVLDVSGRTPSSSECNRGQGHSADAASDGDHPERVSEVYSTPYTSPRGTRLFKPSEPPSAKGDEDEEDAYYSLDEDGGSTSESELVNAPEGDREATAREVERQLVLEAAGLVVSTLEDREHESVPVVGAHDYEHGSYSHRRAPSAPPLSSVTRHKSGSSLRCTGRPSETLGHGRRPAPTVPSRQGGGLSHLPTKDLPPIPTLDLPSSDCSPNMLFQGSIDASRVNREREEDAEMGMLVGLGHLKARSDGSIVHPDDAFERYETFKKRQASQSHGHGHSPLVPHGRPLSTSTSSRMSMSSFDTGSLAPTSPPMSPAASVTPSLRDRDRDRDRESGGGTESRTSQFLSFLGRHARASTPDIAERDRKLVISGPITHATTPSSASGPLPGGETGPPTRADSPMFGSSWASLVDRSALEEIPKQERKRQEAIFELISTEADYMRDVQLIVGLFYSSLMQTLDEEATAKIFSNIEDILLTNTTFLSTLEERQRDCRLYIDRIGDLLEKHMPNMAVYLNYCVNQANAGKVLQQMRENIPALATQLQNLRENPSARNLDLSSYLLVPMQRLTRYPLLIRQILHFTDDVAEREPIFAALQIAEKILEEVNETIRDREGRERLGEFSRSLWIGHGRLDLTAPTRHLGPRKLIKEGVLCKARSGRKLRTLLCNDVLVFVDETERGLYRMPISMNEIQIKPSRSGREDSLIRLYLAYPRGGDTIVLRAANVREAMAWQDAILDANSKAREGIMNVVREFGKT